MRRGLWLPLVALVLALGGCEGAPSTLAGVDAGYSPDAIPAPSPCASVVEPAWPPDTPLPPEFDFPPWVTMPAPGVYSIGWRSKHETTGFVLWGTSERLTDVAVSDVPGNVHHVQLELPPATPVWYEVFISGTGASRKGVFVTPGRDHWRFIHLGETHAPSSSIKVALFNDVIRRFRPHVVVESGDMVDTGSNLSHWRDYMDTSSGWISNTIIMPAHSNHVNGFQGNSILIDMFELPYNERWYTTRYSQVEFFTLDSTFGTNPDVQTDEPAWIADQMARTNDGIADPTFVIAAWHYPACSSSYKSRAASRKWVSENFVDTLIDNGELDMILVGHDKYYERSFIDGEIIHVMTNTGKLSPSTEGDNNPRCEPVVTDKDGESLMMATVGGGLLTAVVVDEEGGVIDTFAIDKRATTGTPVCVTESLFGSERTE